MNRISFLFLACLLCVQAFADPDGIPGLEQALYLMVGIVSAIILACALLAGWIGSQILKSRKYFLKIFASTFVTELIMAAIFVWIFMQYGIEFLDKAPFVLFAVGVAVINVFVFLWKHKKPLRP